jgi:ATP-dependent exoDNAse (exonuclease V) beta subunit
VTRQLGLLAQSFPQEYASTLLELGRYAARNLAEGGFEGGAIETLDGLESLPRGSTESLEAWKGIADLLLTAQGEYRKRLTKNQGFPAGKNDSKQAHADLVESLGRREEFAGLLHSVRLLPPLHYTDEQWRVLLALFNLLPLAVTELKRLFVERGLVDHIEIALSASDALGTPDEPGDVAMLLDYQVRHLLVDEMQDTSAAQYRMIEALTGGWEPGDGRTLYCVGDPMQSIYRFRNAEVGQFLISKEVGIGNIPLEALTLRRNFRSGEGLVDWFNSVFPHVMPDKDDHERSAVSYEAAVPVPQLSGLGACSVYPVFGADKGAEAEVGIEVIEKLLDSESDGDIAVLVRGRSHLAELLRRLRTKGIGYRAVEIDRLTDLPEIIDALALTRAIVHHGDRHAWLALLRSPWVGLDWTDLHALVSGDRETVVWELIHDRARMDTLSAPGRLAVERFRETLQPVMSTSRSDKLRDRVERAWFSLGGPWIPESPDSIDNIYHFFDVVENLEVAGDLPDVAELEEALDTEHVSSHSSSRLQVMTMHRAKGLQFDHVILFGLGRIPRPGEQGVMSWFDLPDEHGHPLKVISPIGPRSEVDKDAVHGYIGQVDAEMNDNELGRLLYVACTRARRSLHLVGNALVYKSGMRPHKRSLLHRLWPFVRDEYERQFDPDRPVPGENSRDPWLVPQLRRFEPDWQVPEPLPLAVKPVSRTADDTAVEFQWVGSGARTAGTLVHRWLQFMVDGQLAADELAEGALRRESLRWAREMGIDDARAGPIVDRTIDALQKMLADDRGRWLLSGDGYAELALTGVIAGLTESVVLDRVKIDVDGVHWIIDYKTSTHEGGNLQRFLAEEVRRYESQLAKYAELYQHYSGVEPRCALYFPLLQSFVEVEPASL